MEVPSITYSNYFGPISKVRWYSVSDYFNEYNVDLYIGTSQTTASQARIENRSNTNGYEWAENIPTNPNQNTLVRDIQILHVPTLKAPEYVVINQAV